MTLPPPQDKVKATKAWQQSGLLLNIQGCDEADEPDNFAYMAPTLH